MGPFLVGGVPVRKSKAITLSLLGLGAGGLTLGCGGDPAPQPAAGPPAEVWPVAQPLHADPPGEDPPAPPAVAADDDWFDIDGKPMPKEWTEGPDGRLIPARQPYDRFGRPWTQNDSEEWVSPPPAHVRTSHLFGVVLIHPIVGGRPGGTVMSKSNFSTISRGGFGTTGGRIGGTSST